MKEIEVQTESKDKEVIKSDVIRIDENSDRIKVIVTVGSVDFMVNHERLAKIHNLVVNAIKNDAKVITIPSWVKINTIKI